MAVSTHVFLSMTKRKQRLGFRCQDRHEEGAPVKVSVDVLGTKIELWSGTVKKFPPKKNGYYTGVAELSPTTGQFKLFAETLLKRKKKIFDDGDPLPVTVTVDEEYNEEPIVVILDP